MKETILFIHATPPWRSPDAQRAYYTPTPQREIDLCLCCHFAQNACDRCDGRGNLRSRRSDAYDLDQLREMMKLCVCKAQIARNVGVSRSTVHRLVKRIEQEVEA